MSASWQARVVSFVVRHRIKSRLGDMRAIERVRKVLRHPLPELRGVRHTDDTFGGVRGEKVETDVASGAPSIASTTLLYLHGGGFVGCSPRTYRPITAALARQGLRVFVPDYRLTPEHPFPAARE